MNITYFSTSSYLVLFMLYLLTKINIGFSRFGSCEKSALMGLYLIRRLPSSISYFLSIRMHNASKELILKLLLKIIVYNV
jgi:hypothetical protein